MQKDLSQRLVAIETSQKLYHDEMKSIMEGLHSEIASVKTEQNTLRWTLFADVEDAAATLSIAGSISITDSTITVSITEAQTAGLTADQRYQMQLWRNESGNKYPLTGFDNLIPEAAPPLA